MTHLFLLAALLQQPQERAKPSDYPVHGVNGSTGIGVEYMAHSLMVDGRTAFVSDYLVIEVEVFPKRGESVMVSQNQFTLRVNGKNPALLAQSSGMVSASLKYADWDRQKRLDATVGDVRLGYPQRTPRFPGDPTTRPLPAPPRAPTDQDRSGIEKQPEETADQLVVKWALPEGEASKPVKGFVYFPHKGKPGSIKKLELIYSTPAGETTLVLK